MWDGLKSRRRLILVRTVTVQKYHDDQVMTLQREDEAALPRFHSTYPQAGGGRRFLLSGRQEWLVCCQHMLLKTQLWLGNEGGYLAIKLPSLSRAHYK